MVFKIRCDRSRRYFDYWKSLPREPGEILPPRSRFLPEDVPELLSTTAIYELVSPDLLKARLQGTAINERFGRDITGENYLDYVAPERRASASRAFWTMAQHPCGMHAILTHRLTSGRDVLVEALGFPYINGEGGNPIVIFQSNEIEVPPGRKLRDEGELSMILLEGRTLIDIGNGVPVFVE
ncbi:PAS domain-containing protein [Aestuariispira insulae]|uniref:PAS domain-containing protein n=1 Tax=Aestuariispira insulae TaxID=1461337 RepID=A0A3D9HSB0_9PROT|nr:PAS domain-containing protein [Aestuariispira insulae]RED52382.1 PAS domain-containing protein [Aestuariispira insulae]